MPLKKPGEILTKARGPTPRAGPEKLAQNISQFAQSSGRVETGTRTVKVEACDRKAWRNPGGCAPIQLPTLSDTILRQLESFLRSAVFLRRRGRSHGPEHKGKTAGCREGGGKDPSQGLGPLLCCFPSERSAGDSTGGEGQGVCCRKLPWAKRRRLEGRAGEGKRPRGNLTTSFSNTCAGSKQKNEALLNRSELPNP